MIFYVFASNLLTTLPHSHEFGPMHLSTTKYKQPGNKWIPFSAYLILTLHKSRNLANTSVMIQT